MYKTKVVILVVLVLCLCKVCIDIGNHSHYTMEILGTSEINENSKRTDVLSSSHREIINRMRGVCDLIDKGHYDASKDLRNRLDASAWNQSTLIALVDHYQQVVYCQVPKVGTTSWNVMYKKLAERDRRQRVEFFKTNLSNHWDDSIKPAHRYEDLYKLGFSRLSRGSDAHNEVRLGLPDPRAHYFKFLVVRHPLERLASGFMNQVNRDNIMIAELNKKLMQHGEQKHDGPYIPFEIFLKYAALPDSELTHRRDIHWRTIQNICEPCQIHYNFVARMETLTSDLEMLLQQLNAEEFIDSFPTANTGRVSINKYQDMYRNISPSILKAVMDKYQADADMFGYSMKDYLND